MKEEKTTITKLDRDEWWGFVYRCNSCNQKVIWNNFNYCPNCGKEIDWCDIYGRKQTSTY